MLTNEHRDVIEKALYYARANVENYWHNWAGDSSEADSLDKIDAALEAVRAAPAQAQVNVEGLTTQEFREVLFNELRPCPFCGSEAVMVESAEESCWYIECTECACGFISGYSSRVDMIPAWNRRVPAPAATIAPDVAGELVVNEYQLEGGGSNDRYDITLCRRRQTNGPDKWAIYRNGAVLSKEYEDGDPWEYEPIPSSRDDKYLKRCRFDSIEEALAHWQGWLQRRPTPDAPPPKSHSPR